MEINESRARSASGTIGAVGRIAALLLALPVVALMAGRGGDMEEKRNRMVEDQIVRRGVKSPRVLDAMRSVERHRFVPEEALAHAYDDAPLRIGHGQTISQPYIVALMTELLELRADDRVLEIGTGSGYQAAVLSLLVAEVYSIEIVEPLGEIARARLDELGYDNVRVRIGDGYQGWPEAAPFDAIIVTAAAPRIPEPLKEQLRDGGRLILPVGDAWQELVVVTRRGDRYEEDRVLPVRFVPMTGEVRQ
jgi:protein-L-isoaspartate(D-aspartate) O-methyltransferase